MESRRERLRAATIREIAQTARELLVAEGADAVSLRAIARRMGMTAPGLYRYFGSHEELLRHLVGEIYIELVGELEAGIAAAGDMSGKFLASARVFRRWALAHPPEYALVFGAPLPGLGDDGRQDFAEECGRRFGGTFLSLFLDLWRKQPFPVPDDEDIDPSLREQLRSYRDEVLEVGLPLGVIQRFLECWVRLGGSISLEVFKHLEFSLSDAEPLFELTLKDLARLIGITYTPPAPRS
ncbi:TetR/AcrR family transcriptional regulator [Actinomadura macrotermitis]|uniref:TetR/AcrR family transcriptional regulator n=1 Tax=Actinomadura macrotermitis TaxID=2585200 RepID=UPI002E26182F